MTNKEAAEYIKAHCNPDMSKKTQWDTAMAMAVKALEHMGDKDTISRQAAIDALKDVSEHYTDKGREWHPHVDFMVEAIQNLPSAQQWIPFNTRSLTEEEKEDHPEWDCILDCELPDDGQRILVSINYKGHEEVQQDEFYSDDGSYLDSNYEIGTEAVAWMPLPDPWRGEKI